MSQEQTQEKCPVSGKSADDAKADNEAGYGFDVVIPKIFRTIIEAMAEGMPEEARTALLALDEKSEIYFVVRSAFVGGVNWSMQVPPVFAMEQFNAMRLKQNPIAQQMVEEMKKRLAQRPDEAEATDAK